MRLCTTIMNTRKISINRFHNVIVVRLSTSEFDACDDTQNVMVGHTLTFSVCFDALNQWRDK